MYTGVGGSPTEYILNKRQYSMRNIHEFHKQNRIKKDQRKYSHRFIQNRDFVKSFFKDRFLEWNDNKTIDQNWIDNGGEVIKQKPKHRYFYLLGTKKTKERNAN